MDAAVSSLPHHCPRLPPLSRLRPVLPARPASLHLLHNHDGSRPHHQWPSVPTLRSGLPRRRIPNAAAGAVDPCGWTSGRRKRGRKGVGLDRAAVERWASILLLADSIRRLLLMQPLDVLAVLLEHSGVAPIVGGGGGGDGLLALLKRGFSGGGQAKKRNRAWKAALGLAIKAASAAAAAAAIWLLLFGKRLL